MTIRITSDIFGTETTTFANREDLAKHIHWCAVESDWYNEYRAHALEECETNCVTNPVSGEDYKSLEQFEANLLAKALRESETVAEINVHNYAARHEAPVCTVEFESFPHTENAEPTNRVLSGSDDFWAAEEWAEPVTLSDGRKATAYYLFSSESITDDAGEQLLAEDYPWDAEHCSWIELAP